MNNAIWSKKLSGSLALALVLVACKSTPMTEPKPAEVADKSTTTQTQTASKPAESAADTSTVKEVVLDSKPTDNGTNPLKDPNNILSKRNIYFEFDSDVIKAEFRPLIEAHAKYLLANTNAKTFLQGNTDDRGPREYNVSLGQRRAVAVKKALNLLGVQDKQIETVSFGKEKATPGCTNEACHQANRRVDIVYEND